MSENDKYNTRLDIKYEHLEIVDIAEIVQNCQYKWFNQSLTNVNNSVVRLGIVEGEYHWHKHDNDDEFFFVLSGKLFIELEDRTIELNPQQGTTITRGIMHKPYAHEKTEMLLVETSAIQPTGD